MANLLKKMINLSRNQSPKKLTLIARTIILLIAELLVNALLWIISAITFLHGQNDGHKILGLALIAWTTGLRHALDADHISAIDNATRRIVSLPQTLQIKENKTIISMRRPVTVGLFFSLGHSTVVIIATVAIAISARVANKFDGFGSIGGIIGGAISGSFLILIGCINTVILYKTMKRIKEAKRKEKELSKKEEENQQTSTTINPPAHFNGIMTRIAMPILRSVDRPWKMYPVGILFGLGFDTASSIALLSVALIAQQQQRKEAKDGGSDASVILFALLFTAGMTMIDSADSCLMIWAYAPEIQKKKGWRSKLKLWRNLEEEQESQIHSTTDEEESIGVTPELLSKQKGDGECMPEKVVEKDQVEDDKKELCKANAKNTSMDQISFEASASKISLLLTTLSILVAFAIGLVVLMGLIGDQCRQCSEAADRQQDSGNGGLPGRWWLAWRRANDNFTYVGAGIVGAFLLCVVFWYSIRWAIQLHQRKREKRIQTDHPVLSSHSSH